MRLTVLLLSLLLLSSCVRNHCEAVYRQASRNYAAGELASVSTFLQAELKKQWPPACEWRLRLLLADVMGALRQMKQALAVLGGRPPDASVGKEAAFRFRMLKGYSLAFTSGPEAGFPLLKEAEGIARAEGNSGWEADVLRRLGNLDLLTRKPEAAEKEFHTALAKAIAAGDQRLQGEIYGSLGFFYFQHDRMAEAARYFGKSIEMTRKTGNVFYEAKTRGNLALVYLTFGEPQPALKELQFAERVAREKGQTDDWLRWLLNLGNVQYSLRQYGNAESYYKQGLGMAKDNPDVAASFLTDLSLAVLQRKDYSAAERYIQQARAIREKAGADLRFTTLAEAEIAHARGDLTKARGRLEPLLAQNTLPPLLRMQVESELGSVFEDMKEPARAGQHYRSAIESGGRAKASLASPSEKVRFAGVLEASYHRYVRFLYRGRELDRALAVTEMSREVERDVSFESAPIRASALQLAAKRENATILSYWLDTEESLVWVITPGAVRVRRLGPRQEIEELVGKASEETYGSRQGTFSEAARRLYEVLVENVLPEPDRRGRFLVAANGALLHWNLEALVAGPAPHYWIRDASVTYVRNLRSLLRQEARPEREGTRALIIGNPLSPNAEFPPLPHAAEEVAAVRKALAGSGEVTVREGKEATAEAFEHANPADYDYVHFATHALSSSSAPLESALILSPSASGYKLTAETILRTPLH
ncbi:MAG: CHAT domain-containing tetratricopeptide repeat protein, partial [Bryobacterales bacterium]|nr:CHAT domain-containing tetratricopeptide repeat protein [Bryobacterales bacterium]